MVRSKRTWLERVFFAAAFVCEDCGRRRRVGRCGTLGAFSLTARCPYCGGSDLHKLKSRDRIDPLFRAPWSRLQWLLGAPILHCAWCRLQFYDIRPLKQAKAAGPRNSTDDES
jgi:hypothetical protein